MKKSLAVMTTAAILASTASIVAYAAAATVNWTDSNVTKVEKWSEDDDAYVAITSGSKAAKIRITVADGYTPAVDGTKVTANSGGEYVVENAADTTVEVTAVKNETTPGGSTGATEPGKENTDGVVWVNGKDTKASKDGTTPASLYKTEQYDQVMMSAGGKWQVAVTPATVDTADKFVAEFDDKGKITKAKDYKTLGSAKIKDGTVTVTAGKEAGVINVWVYEVKNKAVVNATIGEGDAAVKVEPKATVYTVKVAPSMAYTVGKATTVENGAVNAVEKPEKLAKSYAPGDEVMIYFADKKANLSVDATYVLMKDKSTEAELKDGKYEGEGFTAELVAATETVGPALKITVAATATKDTKPTVMVKNVESGKTAKVSLKVAVPEKSDDETEIAVTFDTTISAVTKGADKTAVASGDKVKKDDVLTITAANAGDVITVNGTAVTDGTYTVKGDETKIEIAAAAAQS